MSDWKGQQFGNYRLTRLLGEGGFAEVYLGEHIHLGTFAAIKVAHTQLAGDEMEHFRTEARTIAHLEHPHIVRILDFGVEGKNPFLVMSYAPNGSLRQRHRKGSVLPLDTIVSYVRQVADALQYAHDEKVTHRDIKPENMLLGRSNEVLLSDFGIAIVTESSRYQSTQNVIGTVAYMAPEQIQGKPRPASDQYSLGIVVYEWLSGDRPFHGLFTEVCTQHLFASPPPLREKLPTASSAVEQVVMRALAKDPKDRFAGVQAFATALEQASLSIQQQTPTLLPDQSRQPTMVAIPPTQYWSPLTTLSSGQSQPDAMNRPSGEPQRAKRGPSRRAVVMGLVVVAVATGASSMTWVVLSQNSQAPLISSNDHHILSTPSPSTSAPTSPPQPASHAPPLGTTLLTYRGHSSWLAYAAWAPDDGKIASSGNDQTVQVWGANNGSNIFIYRGHSAGVNAVAWSPDGKRIASASDDMTVQVWDALTGNNVLTYRGHTDIARTVAWSPDGTRLASGSHDTTVQVWNANNGSRIFTYSGHSSRVSSLAWSPDGKHIASASDDTTVQIWDANSGNHILTYRGHSNVVEKVAWSPDGTRIASASGDKTAQVWGWATGRTIIVYRGHSDGLDAVAWSPKGQQVASSSNDTTVQIWNATSGSAVYTYRGHSIEVNALGWSHNGTRIVSGDNSALVQVWQAS